MIRRILEAPRVFLIGILLFLALGFLWASQAQIDKVVRTEGKIIPAGHSQQIQHLEGGIIASIMTQEGATVTKGDLLMTIDNTTADVDLSQAKIKLDSERARAARLSAEAQGKDKVEFPADLKNAPVIEAENNLFASRKVKLNEEIVIHQAQIRQHTAQINEAKQRHVQLSKELVTAEKRSAMMEDMAKNNAASKLEVLDAESQTQRLRTSLADTETALPSLQQAIAGEQARIESGKSEFREQAQAELVSTLGEIDRLKQILTAATARLKRTEIRAPIDGVINHVNVNTVGGVVKPGDTLIELTPKTQQVLIEANAQPRDRGYLRPGLNAEIRVSAYDSGSFGQLKGRVTAVSADSLLDTHNQAYYRVNILVDSIPESYADKVMVPGMTVTADIVTGHRTMLSYLLSPLHKFTYDTFRDPK